MTKTWVNPAIDLTPSSDTNPVGTSHTVTATVSVPSGAGGSLDSAKVTFSVAGVNPQAATEVTTTSGGGGTRVATFTYTGTNLGHDVITATVTQVNGLTTTGGTDTATKDWGQAVAVTKTNGATSRTATVIYDWSIDKEITSGPTGTVAPGTSATVGYRLTPIRTEVARVTTGHVTTSVCVTNSGPSSVTGTVSDTVFFNSVARATKSTTGVTVPSSPNETCTAITVDFPVNSGETSFTNVASFTPNGGAPVTSTTHSFTIPAEATIVSETDENASLADACTITINASCGAPSGVTFPVTLTGADSGVAINYTRQITNNGACSTVQTPAVASASNVATLTEGDTQQQRTDLATAVLATPLCVTVTKGIGSSTNTKTYAYDVAKRADHPTEVIAMGQQASVGYMVTVTRGVASTQATISGSGASETNGICVTNHTGSAGTPTITDTVSPGGSATSVTAASIANGQTVCFAFNVGFTPGSTTAFNNHVDVTLNTKTASTDTPFTLGTQTATNPTATIGDAITTCTSGLTCSAPNSVPPYTENFGPSHTYDVSTTVTNESLCSGPGRVTNTATISGNPQPGPSASAFTTIVPVCAADLAITKTASPSPATSGGDVTYTLLVTNNGPAAATGVTVTDTLPAGTTFALASASQGTCTQAGGTVTCNLGALASGASATVTIVVHTSFLPGTLTNTATIRGNEPDPNQTNNTATTSTQLVFVSNECKVTGGGKLPDGSNFGLEAKGTPKVSGHVNFVDHMGVHLDSTAVTGVRCTGKSAVILGTARVNGASVTFVVKVTDNGEPGRTDTFEISWPGYADGGTLAGGNIQVH